MNRVLGLLMFFMCALAYQPCLGQDALATSKINALKGLSSVAVVVRRNTPRELASVKEWGDMIELSLHRNAPGLAVSDTEKSPNWLELSIITTDEGAFIEISLYRWVRVLASGEEVVAKVWWDSRVVFGGVSRSTVQQSIDALLIGFSADYLRAKR